MKLGASLNVKFYFLYKPTTFKIYLFIKCSLSSPRVLALMEKGNQT